MKNFRVLDGENIELENKIEQKGIKETADNLYELCDKDDEDSFVTADVVFENGKYYVDFNEPSVWADSNIVVGKIL